MRSDGRGEATVRAVHKLLHALGEYAVDTNCRAGNFARLSKSERRRMAADRREVKPPTQQVAAIAAAVPDRFRALVWTLAVAGLRVGEATALRVRDLDFEEGVVGCVRTRQR